MSRYHRPKKPLPLPTVDQFSTFAENYSRLEKGSGQCIWYLPNKQRCCKVKWQPDENDENQPIFQLAKKLLVADTSATTSAHRLEELAQVAERSCCVRYHREKIARTDLATHLAIRWQEEIRQMASATTSKVMENDKPEKKTSSTSEPSHAAEYCMAMNQEFYNIRTQELSLRTPFSKFAVLKGQTMASSILSNLKNSAQKQGSVYIFTYEDPAFKGMLKIGFTGRRVANRLAEWAECGYGDPLPLRYHEKVRHPERVELLTHFELIKDWYALRWCNIHQQSHIEWFQTDVCTVNHIVEDWSSWIKRANPYDKHGNLNAFWRGVVQFLNASDIYITAQLMREIQDVEEGLIDVEKLIEDDGLRKHDEPKVKQEGHFDDICLASTGSTLIKAEPENKKQHQAVSCPVKIEITESQTLSV